MCGHGFNAGGLCWAAISPLVSITWFVETGNSSDRTVLPAAATGEACICSLKLLLLLSAIFSSLISTNSVHYVHRCSILETKFNHFNHDKLDVYICIGRVKATHIACCTQ